MKTQQEIEARMAELTQEHAMWAKKAEEAIVQKDWSSMAPYNAGKCSVLINALKWALGETEMSPRMD